MDRIVFNNESELVGDFLHNQKIVNVPVTFYVRQVTNRYVMYVAIPFLRMLMIFSSTAMKQFSKGSRNCVLANAL